MAQPVKMPSNVFTQFGGLEITTSSTQLQALTDAFIYLTRYPFECNEQLSSRVLAIAALRDVLTAFKSKDLPSPKELAPLPVFGYPAWLPQDKDFYSDIRHFRPRAKMTPGVGQAAAVHNTEESPGSAERDAG